MARERNSRVVVVEEMRIINKMIRSQLERWIISGVVYDVERINGRAVTAQPRKRRPDEYPENDAMNWRVLRSEMHEVQRLCTRITGACDRRIAEIESVWDGEANEQ